MRVLLVVNTSASSVTARARVVIQKSLSADHEVSLAETTRRGHATRLAQGAAAAGTDAVVVLGGDGTVNEAANGIAGGRCALGVLPGGSTNVYARTIGMAADPIEATGQLLTVMAGGPEAARPVAVGNTSGGQGGGRRFLFHVGLGFDAAVVAQVERRSALKRYLGQALFGYAAIDTWARQFDHSRPRFSLEVRHGAGGQVETVGDCYFAIVFKTNPYTFLGERPLNVAPGTGLDTPLSLVAFRSLGLSTILGATAAALRGGGVPAEASSGNRASKSKVRRFSGVQEAVVSPFSPLPYQLDGDYLGEVSTKLRFGFEPAGLRLFVPGRAPQG